MVTALEGPRGSGDKPVDLERELTRRDGGVFATYRLSTSLNRRLACRVVDPLPAYWSRIRLIGIHPEFEPAESTVDPSRIEFTAAVTPTISTAVKYGIRPYGGVDEGDLSEGQRTHPPRIEELIPSPLDARIDPDGDAFEARTRELPPVLRSREAFNEAKRKLFSGVDRDALPGDLE